MAGFAKVRVFRRDLVALVVLSMQGLGSIWEYILLLLSSWQVAGRDV